MSKNSTLNFMKFVSCIMVIFIHADFPGDFGLCVTAIARYAVPFFFMVSGYFSYKTIGTKQYVKKHIKKIFLIAITSTIFYLFFNLIVDYTVGNGNMLSRLLNLDTLKYFFILNEVPYCAHLWFLYSLLYVYIIYYFLYKKKGFLYLMIPILLTCCVSLGIIISLYNLNLKIFVVRNFLFVGLPFFMFGNFINKYHSKILKHISNKFLVSIVILSSFTTILELKYIGVLDVYISTLFLSISIFLLCIKNPRFIDKDNKLSYLGEKYSLGIYVGHVVIKHTIEKLILPSNYFSNHVFFAYMFPIILTILSFVFVIFYYKCKKIIMKKYIYN